MDAKRETLIGAAVMGVLVLTLASNALDRKIVDGRSEGFQLTAAFYRTDGLTTGSDVRLAGMKVGEVDDLDLDPDYRVIATLHLSPGTQIPADSAAIIETDGLMGGKYIELQPGGEEDMLRHGQRIEYTQDSVVIEELLARIIAQAHARREAEARAAPPPPPPPGRPGFMDDLFTLPPSGERLTEPEATDNGS